MDRILSIAIPTFNRAKQLDEQLTWLARALRGFEDQCEIIISDNCSTDNTQSVIEHWRTVFNYLPFRSNRNDKNLGTLGNIAYCITAARTRYLWTVGDDDVIKEEALAYILDNLKARPNLTLLYLNFSGRDVHTGQVIGERWLDVNEEIEVTNSKPLFQRFIKCGIGSVIFITATVYRTEMAQAALKQWPASINNWAGQAYWTGYCAAHGSMLVSKDIFVVCIINASHWQQDPKWKLMNGFKHFPEIFLKLQQLGYSDRFCRRMILTTLKQNQKNLKQSQFNIGREFCKLPLQTAQIVVVYLWVLIKTVFQLFLLDFLKIQQWIPSLWSELSYRVARLGHALRLPQLQQQDRQIVDSCQKYGAFITSLALLQLAATPALIEAASAELLDMKKRVQTGVDRNGKTTLPPQIRTVTHLPAFANWARDPRLLNIVENYIGLPVTFQGVHLRRDFVHDRPIITELWHKDLEDRRILKLIVYLEDVSESHGPFEYIPKSKSRSLLLPWYIKFRTLKTSLLGIDNGELQKFIPRSSWRLCPGSMGTVIFVDTGTTYHHGTLRTQDRTALFFVYTAQQPKRPELCSQYSDQTYAN